MTKNKATSDNRYSYSKGYKQVREYLLSFFVLGPEKNDNLSVIM